MRLWSKTRLFTAAFYLEAERITLPPVELIQDSLTKEVITINDCAYLADNFKGDNKCEVLKLKSKFQTKILKAPTELNNLTNVDYARLCCTKKGVPMLELCKAKYILRVALEHKTSPIKNTINIGDKYLQLVDWDDTTKCYNTIKEVSMIPPPAIPKLTKTKQAPKVDDVPLLEGLEDVSQDLADAVADDLLKAAGVMPKEEPTSKAIEELEKAHIPSPAVTKKAATQKEEQVVTVEDKVEEVKDTADPVANKEEAQEQKRSRTPRLKKKLQDLTNIIEALRTDPPENMTQEDVLNEVRQLRDLIKMASCRQANLMTLFMESIKDKVKKAEESDRKLKEIQCLLSQMK